MIEHSFDLQTAAGAMQTFRCRPERDGPHPAVLMLMDAPGIREELHDMVASLREHFARSGARGGIEHYPGVHHGFAFPGRRVHDRPAAERHWERLVALYRRNL